MKLLAGRPRDLEDARLLVGLADEQEIARARRAVTLITKPGYELRQDIELSLEKLLFEPTRLPS